MMSKTISKPDHNCWRIEKTPRASFLIDAASYFEAFVSAVRQAQESVYIAGWDFHSQVNLLRRDSTPLTLGELLNQAVSQNPKLHINILCWDFVILYALERDWLPVFNLGWKTSRRIHYKLDNEIPMGASHHQKFVVVDDSLAFCGGIDLTRHRWDTPKHIPQDKRRVQPDGSSYGPYHDIQMAVNGDAAKALGDLFRLRWQWAVGKSLPSPDGGRDIWPEKLEPDIADVDAAICRTLPAYKDRPEIREIETLYLDAIASAEKRIYIENQYLTSSTIADALVKKLQSDQPPEIIIVLPENSGGWLEQSTMDSLRQRILKRLFEADIHGRLRVYYPVVGESGTPVYVHAKIMVIDDQLALVGSANLSNRSMGLDSECGLAIEAAGNSKTSKAIDTFLYRLLADHLGVSAHQVEESILHDESLTQTIKSLSQKNSGLVLADLEQAPPVDGAELVPDEKLLDPEKPLQFDRIVDEMVEDQEDSGTSSRKGLIRLGATILVLLVLAGMWRFTSISQWMTMERLSAWAQILDDSPFAILAVSAAYVVGGLVMAPVSLLTGVVAVVFSFPLSTLYALVGCLANAAATYGLGNFLGRDAVRSLSGRRLNRVSKHLAKQGVLTMALVRNIPIAPFTVVNVVAGVSKIKFRDYLLGTLIGMAPGVLAITIFAESLIGMIKDPSAVNIAIAAGVVIIFAFGIWWIRKRLSRPSG
jgi:phospholipase D1/2